MCQRFYANPDDKLVHPNGTIGYRPGGPTDCLGPYARVENCPIRFLEVVDYEHRWYELDDRYTAYATGYADTYFSVPAATRVRAAYLRGYFSYEHEGGTVFVVTSDRMRVVDGKVSIFRNQSKYQEWVEVAAKRVNKW
jgi:hypothetical protein